MFNSWTIFLVVVCQVIFVNSLLIGNQPNDLIPKAPYCGATFAERIVGGSETKLEEYPWLALLTYEKDNETQYACGGFLINYRYVLTAAHCVTGQVLEEIGKLVSVRLGEHNITSAEDCETENNVTFCNAPPQDIPVESVIIYAEYNPEKAYHDIALIRLSREAQREDSVMPICLPHSETPESAVGTLLAVAGWGRTEHGKQSDVKLQVRIPLYSENDCNSAFENLMLYFCNGRPFRISDPNCKPFVLNYDEQFCAGGEEGKDSCSGDSGGPVMETVKGFWYAKGIVLGGINGYCGRNNIPGFYTRTSRYVDWIHKNVLP